AGLLVPGCHVDVIATIRKGDREMAKTIVENVQVSAVGQRLSKEQTRDKEPARTVTLLMTPRNAEAIELAGNIGRPRLVLRGNTDRNATQSPGVKMDELLGENTEAQLASARTGAEHEKMFQRLMD